VTSQTTRANIRTSGSVVVDVTACSYIPNGWSRFARELSERLEELSNICFWSQIDSPARPQRSQTAARAYWPTLLAAQGPAVLHDLTNGETMDWLDRLPSHVRLLVTLHDVIPLALNFAGEAYQRQLRLILERADRIATDSFSARADIERFAGVSRDVVDVIYPGITTFEKISPQSARDTLQSLRIDPQAALIVTLATTRLYKQSHLAVHTLRHALNKGLNAQLLVVGSLSHQSGRALTQAVRSLGVADRVRVTGPLPDQLLAAAYTSANVFVHPSLAEGFGLPPLEALLCGAPIAIMDIPIYRELFSDKWPLAPVGNDEAFANIACGFIARSDVARLQAKGMAEKLLGFTWDRCVEAYVRVYESLLCGDSHRGHFLINGVAQRTDDSS
jgi:glycosyltransferase involved in cell wall biosynthesis